MSPYTALVDRASWTELYQLLRRRGDNPPVNASKEELAKLFLQEEETATEHSNVFDEYREGIYHYIDEHWAKLRMQITCPAKAREVTACNGCPDTQVVACITNNPNLDRFIQLKRKSK